MVISSHQNNAHYISPQGEELVRHGTSLFPVAFYHDNLERFSVHWHWHEEMEAIYVAKGETRLSAGLEKFTLHQGQAIFINSNVLHAGRGIQGTGCHCHSVVFHPRLVGGGIDSIFWQSYLRPLISSGVKSFLLDGAADWHGRAQNAIERAWRAGADEPEGYEFLVRAALSELVFLASAHLPAVQKTVSSKTLRDSSRIRPMLQFINEHFSEPITIGEIAASASISESECLRCFNSTIEQPPIQYLKKLRLQKAAEQLSSTEKKIGDIAADCGFPDTSYFTRAFKAARGMSPGEYRKMVSADP